MAKKIRVHVVAKAGFKNMAKVLEKRGFEVDFSDVLQRVSYGKHDFTILIRPGLPHSEGYRAESYVEKERLVIAESADDAFRKITERLSKR